ncbi:MAG: nucleotide pyrophosphohydrolase [Woeseia sp.]|nr:nucleotide pyrophosphohydrolase [Woeseia sp.]|tara:strand:+ start:455 stop:781 length:327 start_codon:yes stop_codon:yes gene_type:complete
MDIKRIGDAIDQFAEERDWDKFHTPKNLAMALSVEASELVEIFQWKEGDDVDDQRAIKAAEEELADIFYYTLRMCQKMDINLEEAFFKKMVKNREKHPIRKVKGKLPN